MSLHAFTFYIEIDVDVVSFKIKVLSWEIPALLSIFIWVIGIVACFFQVESQRNVILGLTAKEE